jgi:D-alanine-D-alanine ligase
MAVQRQALLLLTGGPGTEHEIAWQSVRSIYKHCDFKRYQVFVVSISKQGNWFLCMQPELLDQITCLDEAGGPVCTSLWQPVTLLRHHNVPCLWGHRDNHFHPLAVCLPVLHGLWGEDGALQGYLEVVGLPYVGNRLQAMANTFDKIVTKKLCQQHGISVAPYFVVASLAQLEAQMRASSLVYPVFVKAAAQGSSIGVYKVYDDDALKVRVKQAFSFSAQVLVEACILGRELEAAAVSFIDRVFVSSVFAEIVVQSGHEFYTYEAKYKDAHAAECTLPAILTSVELAAGKRLVAQAYAALGCTGFARIDCFLAQDGQWYLNELNGLPGFTQISLFPLLCAYDGLDMSTLIAALIKVALARPMSLQPAHRDTHTHTS